MYKNKTGNNILNIPYLNKKISLDLLEINYSDLIKRIQFNSTQNINIQNNMKLNIDTLIDKSKFMTIASEYANLKNQSKNYNFEKENNHNKQQYYKDIIADINKFVRQNKHLKQDYERQIAYILKYTLNKSNTIQEAISNLKELGIYSEYKKENTELLLNIDNIKLSSKYLKIDIDKTLNKNVSFKYEVFKKVNDVRKVAKSKEEFIKLLKEQYNINTTWTSEKKYITFTDEKGNKKRNSAFYPPENWTKSKLEESFKYNENRFYKEKKEKDSNYIENQQYVKSKVYEHLNNCKNYENFTTKLEKDYIIFDKETCKFKNNNFTFWESKYFNINKEYIEERFEQNKIQNLYV